jgi:hypothetical protein
MPLPAPPVKGGAGTKVADVGLDCNPCLAAFED